MDGQLMIVALVVALAAGYLVVAAWRTWNGKKGGCSGGCCGKKISSAKENPSTTMIPVEQLTLRRRPPE